MKKFLSSFICAFILVLNFCSVSSLAAAPSVDISVNNNIIKTDRDAFIFDSLTYVPIRFVSEALGFDVSWDSESNAAIIEKEDEKAVYYVGKAESEINGDSQNLEAKAYNVNSRVFVPVRNVCEFLDAEVEWDRELYIVEITSNHAFDNKSATKSYKKDDIYWMSRIIESESGGEPMQGKIAVGNVVINRVKSSDFPNTIYGVIFDRKYGVQFEPTINGHIYKTPTHQSVSAAKRALNGENNIGNCLYFLNPKIASNFWIVNNRQFFTSISNHDFYL